MPHAGPAHPCPGTALCTLQVIPVTFVPETEAKNCIVLGCALDGTTKEYCGDMETDIGPVCWAMKTVAVPVFNRSA